MPPLAPAAMLDYENQMFLDILNEDGLIVSAKGLGLEDVFLSLLKVYSDPGNLVIVLGTTGQEENYYIDRLTAEGVKPVPRVITSESGSTTDRKNLYLQGGVLFLSPRILVVDLLKDRLPIAHVTGVLVYRAHSIINSCQEAFAIRLYRQKNKTGFVKAFSNSAQSFTMGFSNVQRVMKMLFVKQLCLWPRFQAIVQSSLSACKPVVVEMHVQLTPAMTRIQNAVLELMAFTVKELKRINPTFDFDELTVENAIAKSFHKVLQSQLDPVWHQLSAKTKLLVSDLKILRVILNYLTRYDCITFNTFVTSFRTQTYALHSSGWLLLDSANVLFQTANQRVLEGNKEQQPANEKAAKGNKATKASSEKAGKGNKDNKAGKGKSKANENAGKSKKAKKATDTKGKKTSAAEVIDLDAEDNDSDIDYEAIDEAFGFRKKSKRRLVFDNPTSQPSKSNLSQPSKLRLTQPSKLRLSQPSKLRLSQPSKPSPSKQGREFKKKKVVEPGSDDDMFASDEEEEDEEDEEEEEEEEEEVIEVEKEEEEKDEETIADSDKKEKKKTEKKEGIDPEPSPKWLVLKQILSEIKDVSKTTRLDFSVPDKVLILVQDKRTAKQLQDFLLLGSREMLLKLHEQASFKKLSHSAGRPYEEPNARSPTKMFQKFQPCIDDDLELLLNTQMVAESPATNQVAGKLDPANQAKEDPKSAKEVSSSQSPKKQSSAGDNKSGTFVDEYRNVYILSQKQATEDTDANYQVFADKIEELDISSDVIEPEACFQPPIVIIQTFKADGNPLSLPQTLDEARPRFIVMYDIEVSAIRRIEVYQSNLPATQIHVYFVVFGGSVEEQAYLTALRREKEAFEFLIKEKAIMVIPQDQDGKSDTCEALVRDSSKPNETVNTRRGGAGEVAAAAALRQRTIIVDMREFNSELPSMIHRRGIEVDPITLQIGDYILSPDICVERKSISDLIGSLNNGRLYNQAKAMTRYYANPMLLIEFDQNKPMTLQGNYYISNDMSSNDVSAKLILLTLHFPQLKLVWSPSPYATAQLFEELKNIRDEPDAIKAASVGADLEQDLDVAEKYNPAAHDLMARLPGVTTKNIHSLLNHGQSLDNLISYDKAKLTQLMGNGQQAECFHDGLHKVYNPGTEADAKRGGARWRGRSRGGFKRTT